MRLTTQRVFAWCAPAMMVLFIVGFLIGHLIPPPGPNESGVQIARFYQEHSSSIRIGLTLGMFGAALLGPFVAVLAAQLKRMSNRSMASAYCQLVLGTLLIVEILVPFVILGALTFRSIRDPAVTLAMSDFAWLFFVGVVSTASLEVLLVGIAILQDKQLAPLFPRWAGIYSVAVGVITAPGCLAFFFTTGPFAWNGIVSWWIALAAFGSWFLVFGLLILQIPEPISEPDRHARSVMTSS
jgi:hypothetical protein